MWTRSSLPCAVAAACVLAGSVAAHADVVTVPASRDTTIYQSTTGALANGSGQGFFTGSNSGGSRRRGLVYFDVASAVPAGATITGVSLSLVYDRGSGASSVSLHRLLADWGEGTSDAGDPGGGGAPATSGDATWLHRFSPGSLWTNQGGDFQAVASASLIVEDFGVYSWSSAAMLADVQGWYSSPGTNFGWAVLGDEGLNGSAKRFVSRENPVTGDRPALVVTYIPTPGAFVPGLVVLAAGRRRRR